jgi:hypothetical protein
MARQQEQVVVEASGREVGVSNPGKLCFIHARPASLEALLELAARDERGGLGDAPWPPHFRKQKGEPPRVQPSRARAAKR